MKKTIAITLALILIISLAACGNSSSSEVKEPSNVSGTVTDGGSKQAEHDNISDDNDNKSEQTEQGEITVTETVLVDESGVKITAKSLSMDEILGPELKLLIENNSGKDLTIQCRNASVNGYMVETMMSVDIVNGKKANDELTFMESDLEACGITNIADMDFSFHMFTTEDWDTYLDTPQINLKTSIADTYEYVFDDSGNVAYDADGIKVVIKGLTEDSSIFGPSIVVYLENNTDKAITIQTRDVSINGFMVDAMFSSDVMPGKKAIDTITFMESELEANEITKIEDVELSFHIFDSESWSDTIDTDVISITF